MNRAKDNPSLMRGITTSTDNMQTYYVAADGTTFESAQLCDEYENLLPKPDKRLASLKIYLADLTREDLSIYLEDLAAAISRDPMGFLEACAIDLVAHPPDPAPYATPQPGFGAWMHGQNPPTEAPPPAPTPPAGGNADVGGFAWGAPTGPPPPPPDVWG